MSKLLFFGFIAIIFVALDLYLFQAVRVLTDESSPRTRLIVHSVYWALAGLSFFLFLFYNLFPEIRDKSQLFRQLALFYIFAHFISTLIGSLFVAVDDIIRLTQWVYYKFVPNGGAPLSKTGEGITRSEFLAKTAVTAAVIPSVTMGFGILSGAHDYRIHRVKVPIADLPKQFEGIRIGQLSDIHSGSFFDKKAVIGGVEMLQNEKPDMVFFTGDLVNNVAEEVKDYVPIFGKIKAPLGVYSTLGNHDYGDYVAWESEAAKQANLRDLKAAHKEMGWDLLMNENRIIKEGGEQLAILGVENWGNRGRFPKYGRLGEAHAGTEEAATKVLLSHDPSHWDGQVRPEYQDIDLMLAGHTHGFQFGVEWGPIKWSPAQYMYPQWAGLYTEGKQNLYVNRGFGYLGYPGRIGILPEVTVLELVKA